MKKRLLALFLLLCLLFPLASCNVGKEIETPSVNGNGEQSIPKPTVSASSPRVTIKDTCVYLFVGSTHQLRYDLDSTGATDDVISWYSSTGCVSVSDGLVTAKKEGYAYVSANGGNECLICIIPKNMPTLSIDTNNHPVNSKDAYTTCTVSLDTDNSNFCFTNASAGIRLRGNSTAGYDKKPYRLRFDTKRNLLGMNGGNEFRSWVLLAEWLDDSLLRNSISLTLGSMMLGEYSSDWRYVSLHLNGKFVGVYLLCEQSQINENRINIEEAGLTSTALTSGYLFEVDASTRYDSNSMFRIYHSDYDIVNLEGEKYTWTCNDSNEMLQYISLKNEGYSNDQLLFTKFYLRSVFDIIYNATYNNKAYVFKYDFLTEPNKAKAFLTVCKNAGDFKAGLVETDALTPREAIEKVIDIDSWARMYIFSETVCNNDDLKKSFYLWVDFSENGSGKLTLGCPWDHDGAFVAWPGNSKDYNYRNTEEYFAAKRNPWYVMIMCNPWFVEVAKAHWQELYDKNNGYESVIELIPQISDTYCKSFDQEYAAWPFWRTNDRLAETQKTQNWLRSRILWMNSEFGAAEE